MREGERETEGKRGNKISLVSHELPHCLLTVILPLLSRTTHCVPAVCIYVSVCVCVSVGVCDEP